MNNQNNNSDAFAGPSTSDQDAGGFPLELLLLLAAENARSEAQKNASSNWAAPNASNSSANAQATQANPGSQPQVIHDIPIAQVRAYLGCE